MYKSRKKIGNIMQNNNIPKENDVDINNVNIHNNSYNNSYSIFFDVNI